MNQTELRLLVIHDAAAVPLADICVRYLNLSWQKAREAASVNRLPFPTFRLTDSQKAPLMVSVTDLARHIDTRHAEATASWEHSQV